MLANPDSLRVAWTFGLASTPATPANRIGQLAGRGHWQSRHGIGAPALRYFVNRRERRGSLHTLERRVRARGLQQGRVPSRGALSAFPSECEICSLAHTRH